MALASLFASWRAFRSQTEGYNRGYSFIFQVKRVPAVAPVSALRGLPVYQSKAPYSGPPSKQLQYPIDPYHLFSAPASGTRMFVFCRSLCGWHVGTRPQSAKAEPRDMSWECLEVGQGLGVAVVKSRVMRRPQGLQTA